MNRLPTGEYLTEETSPDGKYTLKVYVTNGGATTSYSIRGELVFNEQNNKAKNIYWNYREETADIIWKDHNTVVINGHTLEVPGDKFDFRHINDESVKRAYPYRGRLFFVKWSLFKSERCVSLCT
ncbi:hypothetical protein JOC86_004276 [Bacillus pakistanensis]|uniref:Uncharacterized protein n=1 Tax=Rossellomorea pakistanensis TaxID=992288 RepID=A0ABS2NIK4_9BACI|nr:hypothetical protein [Bacillus pakistanensis]